VMAADRPFVCIPEPRPFGEQEATGARLGALGAAVAVGFWPGAADWPDLIDRAMALPPQARRSLSDAEGAQKAAVWLARYAAAPPTSASEPAA
jgi:hypothetical protein